MSLYPLNQRLYNLFVCWQYSPNKPGPFLTINRYTQEITPCCEKGMTLQKPVQI